MNRLLGTLASDKYNIYNMPFTRKEQDLPFGFVPTDKQKRRLKNGCVVRKCEMCGDYFTTKPNKNQCLCMRCYTKYKRTRPVLF